MLKKATFKDLAEKAAVSPATVSRVAAGLTSVDPAIRQRVQEAARELGIELTRKRDEAHRLVAFVLSNRDAGNPFHARVLAGAESYLTDQGWDMLFLTFNYAADVPTEDLYLPPALQRKNHVRGLILGGVNSANLLQALQIRSIPFSVLGNNLLSDDHLSPCDVVNSDDVQGAFEVSRHLIGQGHRDIWFIGNTRLPWFTHCGEGYQRAMLEAGLPPLLCELQSDGRELGYLGTKSILARRKKVSAIFAGSDSVASGAYTALREAGISVPDQVSVTGFSDADAACLHPPLTSVREFPEELGRHLAEFTLNRIKQPELPPQRLTIPTQLVIRQSTSRASVGAVPVSL